MNDAAVMHTLFPLVDYPVLAELAAKSTQANRPDGRACRAIYDAALHDIDWQAVSDREREFMRQLGIAKPTEMLNELFQQHHEILKGLSDSDTGNEP